jgi:hypothetical protein
MAELVDDLALGPATLDDWRHADARVRNALLCAVVRHAYDEIEQLMVLRLCVEYRIDELVACKRSRA